VSSIFPLLSIELDQFSLWLTLFYLCFTGLVSRKNESDDALAIHLALSQTNNSFFDPNSVIAIQLFMLSLLSKPQRSHLLFPLKHKIFDLLLPHSTVPKLNKSPECVVSGH
jgi:hypothetical protein